MWGLNKLSSNLPDCIFTGGFDDVISSWDTNTLESNALVYKTKQISIRQNEYPRGVNGYVSADSIVGDSQLSVPHIAVGLLLCADRNRCRCLFFQLCQFAQSGEYMTQRPERKRNFSRTKLKTILKDLIWLFWRTANVQFKRCVFLTFGGEHCTTKSTSGISRPRAATLVATRTSKVPFLKPFSVSSRCFWGMSPCKDCALWTEFFFFFFKLKLFS